TDADRVRAGRRVGRLDLETGHEPRDRLVGPRNRTGLDVLALHGGHGTGHVLLELRPVPDGHDRVQLDRLGLELEVGSRGPPGYHHDTRVLSRAVPDDPGP